MKLEMVNGKLTVNNRPARWCQWTLAVADIDGQMSGKGEGINVPGSMAGLPGGNNVSSEEELFQKYDVRVEGETNMSTPGGGKVKVGASYKAKRATDFTGPGIRSKEVDAEQGERNDLQAAERVVDSLLNGFKRDAAGSVNDLKKKEERQKLAAALRALAEAL